MPEWKQFVRRRLGLPGMRGLREERIVEEIAGQLEDFYSEARSRGESEEAAKAWAMEQVTDWDRFASDIVATHGHLVPSGTETWLERSEEDLRRRGRRWSLPADILQDLRQTLRTWRTQPAIWVLTVMILALGIGATTTIFSVVNGVLLEALPYAEPQEMVYFEHPSFPAPYYRAYESHSQSFSTMAGVWESQANLTGGGTPERLKTGLVTPRYFAMFGASASIGRLLTPDDYAGVPAYGVMGNGFWKRRFGSDPSVVGTVLTIGGRAIRVVGVLDEGWVSPSGLKGDERDIWLPLDTAWTDVDSPNFWILEIYARLRPDTPLPAAMSEMDGLSARLADEDPGIFRDQDGAPRPIDIAAMQTSLVGDVQGSLLLLLGAVVLLLGIACANVANLFLARGTDRVHDVALRGALGAGRGRIVTQLLTESVTFSLAGGALGVLLSFGGVRAFEVLNPGNIPLIQRIAVDPVVLGFAVGVSMLTGLLFGMVPAWQATRVDVADALKDTTSRSTGSRSRTALRNGLVVAEIALALVLLAGGGLLFNSFIRVRSVDPGFQPDGLVALPLQLDGEQHTEEYRKSFGARLLERVSTMPGVSSAAIGYSVPFSYYGNGFSGWGGGKFTTNDGREVGEFTMIQPVTPGYLETLRIPVRGRSLQAGDAETTPLPAIVTEDLAEALYPGEDPIGRRYRDQQDLEFRIVGVVSGLRYWGLGRGSDSEMFIPWMARGAWLSSLTLVARAEVDPTALLPALRSAVWEVDGDIPLPEAFTLTDRIAESLTVPRFYTAMLVTFALVAFLLAASGIYGSMLYSVGRRRRELSIRTALGADRGTLVGMVVRQGALLTGIGLVLGTAGALMVTRFLASMMFGITTTDVPTFLTAALLLGLVAVTASFLPAWHAASGDPVEVLRSE